MDTKEHEMTDKEPLELAAKAAAETGKVLK
jgi:hypothetical protein